MENETQQDVTQDKQSSEQQSAPTNSGGANKMLIGGIVVVVIAAIIGAAMWFLGGDMSTNADPSAAVAVVNGEEITRAEYDAQLQNVEQSFQAQGQTVTDEIRQQLLNSLIERELIVQYAQENNITASSEDVDEQYERFSSQFGDEEEFNSFLESQSVTEAEVREDIEKQLVVQAVLEAQAEGAGLGEVSDEDVQARYDELVAGTGEGQEAPELSEVEPQVRAQLEQEQQGEVYEAFVAELRQDADIEVLL
ncbi:MAG: SurA N-terminal domain-containing protein [Candidatus Paceibacterota bacterium]